MPLPNIGSGEAQSPVTSCPARDLFFLCLRIKSLIVLMAYQLQLLLEGCPPAPRLQLRTLLAPGTKCHKYNVTIIFVTLELCLLYPLDRKAHDNCNISFHHSFANGVPGMWK